MKTKLLKILLLVISFTIFNISSISSTFAAEESQWIKVTVTEKIPGANCTPKDKDKNWVVLNYECNVAKWFTSVTEMMWNIIKYFTYIAALWWVLFIIINGILYSMWWAEPSMKDDAKKRITATLVWLVVLFLSWVILNLIAPWIYK